MLFKLKYAGGNPALKINSIKDSFILLCSLSARSNPFIYLHRCVRFVYTDLYRLVVGCKNP